MVEEFKRLGVADRGVSCVVGVANPACPRTGVMGGRPSPKKERLDFGEGDTGRGKASKRAVPGVEGVKGGKVRWPNDGGGRVSTGWCSVYAP